MIRRFTLCWTLLAGATFLAGCAGDPGAKGDPGIKGDPGSGVASINAVTPGRAFLERSIDVAISGNGTAWSDKTTVDFGAGIKVDKLTLASPTALLASITIEVSAAVGARDVTVEDPAGNSVFKGGFAVRSPLVIDSLPATLEQGGVAFGHARNLEIASPFDLDNYQGTLVALSINGEMGVSGAVRSASLFDVDYLLLVDVDAKVGGQGLTVSSGLPGATTSFIAPDAFTVKARSATSLLSGNIVNGTIAGMYDTGLFTYTAPAADVLLELSVTTIDAQAAPTIFLLPKSGKFQDLLGNSSAFILPSKTADQYYLVVADQGGYSGFDYSVAVNALSYVTAAEAEPNGTDATANLLPKLPAMVSGASLGAANDQDWFAITVTAAEVGKRIHVSTPGGDPYTDTIVDVFSSDGTTSLGGPSSDTDYREDFVSDPTTAAGTYYVQIRASTYFTADHADYDAFIQLQ